MNSKVAEKRPKLVVGVTVGVSAFSLLRGQLEWFERNGWEVILVSTPDDSAEKAARREGVAFVGIPMRRGISPMNDLAALIRWVRFLRIQRPDAVNVGTPKAALVGILAAWLTRVPRRLYVVRGLRIEGASGSLRWILWCMEKLVMTLATDVLFVSDSLANEANRRRLFRKDISWVIGSGSSNGVNAEAIMKQVDEVNPDELREKLEIPSGSFVVGFIGRVTKDKGIDTLIQAFQDPHLSYKIYALVIGPVEDQALLKDLKFLGNRVKNVPWTADVWEYLPAMNVLCLPTLREGFPNVVLEAASAGIPAITTRATGAVDSVIPGKTGELIDIGDNRALVNILNKMNLDRTAVHRLGLAARHRAINDFRPENTWLGLEEILNGVRDTQYARKASADDSRRE